MRVLVATTAGPGHYDPMLPFARACVAAGHQVAVAAPRSFADRVTRSGFDHLPFDDADPAQLGAVFARLDGMSPDEANAIVVGEVFGRLDAEAALPGLSATLRSWAPDVVLRESAELGSYLAAENTGLPHVQVDISLATFMNYADLVEEPLVALGAPPGLASLRTSPHLSLLPASMDGPGHDPATVVHRFRPEPAADRSAPLPDWWGRSTGPLVYVSFGTVTHTLDEFAGIYPAVVAALEPVPARILLTTGSSEVAAALGPTPPHVHVEAYWPQADVMPHAAAVVCHGGLSTTMLALTAGVPLVLVPQFADQFHNAERAEELGAGIALAGGARGITALPGALDRVLSDPTFGTGAERIAAEAASLPPVSKAPPLLERLAAR